MTETQNNKNMKKEQRFIKSVIRRLGKVGFECHEELDLLKIKKGEKIFEAEIQRDEHSGKHRVQFYYEFTFESMERLTKDGLLNLASESNNHSPYTTTHFWDDSFSCRVETLVGSSKEFVAELDFAIRQIGETHRAMEESYPMFQCIFLKQPERRPIGFLTDRYHEEEKREMYKLAAQARPTFANETNVNTNH